jgi:hypothetical protein
VPLLNNSALKWIEEECIHNRFANGKIIVPHGDGLFFIVQFVTILLSVIEVIDVKNRSKKVESHGTVSESGQ